jgi:hypothetical protein
MGVDIVLANPCALYDIRDILFESTGMKQVDRLEIATRSLLLETLCALASLKTDSIYGYHILCQLLEDKKVVAHNAEVKTDPQEILKMIIGENDMAADLENENCYTHWMRELQYTVERHLETITFLSQVPRQENYSVTAEDGVMDYIVSVFGLLFLDCYFWISFLLFTYIYRSCIFNWYIELYIHRSAMLVRRIKIREGMKS